MIRFNNDYNHGAHPAILEALATTNTESYGGYGIDPWCRKASDEIKKYLNCDENKLLVVGSPVYYASPAGTLISFLDRLFFSSKFDKTMKVGASVAVARRGGTTATFDVLNKYFTISNMPIVSSSYWNNVHGAAPGEAKEDAEGLQTMRRLGKNMAFLIKAIRLAKEEMPLPVLDEPRQITNFIR